MSAIQHTEHDFVLHGQTGEIRGAAVFDVRTAYDLSGDVGGVDGWTVENCELVGIEIDRVLVCDRNTAIGVVGRDALEHIERDMGERVDAMLPDLMGGD